jgi:hypothetical protein
MDFISLNTFITSVALFLVVLVFRRALYFRRKAALLETSNEDLQQKLTAATTDLQALQKKYQESLDFQKNLSEAEITTRLQQPRLSIQLGHSRSEAPERYLYVRSLAQNGMSAEEIASVLSISTQEAEQLVNLSKLASIAS